MKNAEMIEKIKEVEIFLDRQTEHLTSITGVKHTVNVETDVGKTRCYDIYMCRENEKPAPLASLILSYGKKETEAVFSCNDRLSAIAEDIAQSFNREFSHKGYATSMTIHITI